MEQLENRELLSGIVNGDFSVSDPGSAQFGWTLQGAASVSGGVGILNEDPQVVATEFKQTITLPQGTSELRFTIVDSMLQSNGSGNPIDAFDAALLDATTMQPVVGPPTGLMDSDAFLNIQQSGEVFYAPQVVVPGATNSGEIAALTFPLTITVDLSGVAADATVTLFFDLLSFAPSASSLGIDNVIFVSTGDTTPPNLTLPGDITSEATGPSGATVTYEVSAVDLVDGRVAAICAPASGATFALGTTAVNCSASDASGNVAMGSFRVTVRDTTPPQLTVPQNISAEATGPSGAGVSFAISANDLVNGAVAVSCTPPSGNTFPIGETTVSCSTNDSRGNTAMGGLRVTVRDMTPPSLNGVPADFEVPAVDESGTFVDYADPTADDAVDPDPTVTCVPASGALFPVGTTTVRCTARDNAGNIASDEFRITVTGSLGPKITDVRLAANTRQILGIVLTFDRELNPVEAEDLANYVLNARGPDHSLGTSDDRTRIIQSATYAVDPDTGQVTVRLELARRLRLGRIFALTVKSGVDRVRGLNTVPLDGNGDGQSGDDAVIRFGRGSVLRYVDRDGDVVRLEITEGALMDLVQSSSEEFPRLRTLGDIARDTVLSGRVRRRGGSNGRAELDLLGAATAHIELPGKFALRTQPIAASVDELLDHDELSRSLAQEGLIRP